MKSSLLAQWYYPDRGPLCLRTDLCEPLKFWCFLFAVHLQNVSASVLPQPGSQHFQGWRYLITPHAPRQQTGAPGLPYWTPEPHPDLNLTLKVGLNQVTVHMGLHIYIYFSFHLHCLLVSPFSQNILSFNPPLPKHVDRQSQTT